LCWSLGLLFCCWTSLRSFWLPRILTLTPDLLLSPRSDYNTDTKSILDQVRLSPCCSHRRLRACLHLPKHSLHCACCPLENQREVIFSPCLYLCAQAIRILQAMVDSCAENGWLTTTLRVRGAVRWLSPVVAWVLLPTWSRAMLVLFSAKRSTQSSMVLGLLIFLWRSSLHHRR
jgi:hypothetical protein